MQKVILIEEENHGLIGVADTYADAIDFLVAKQWIYGDMENYLGDGVYKTVEEDLGEEWLQVILHWDIRTFGAYFEGCFYLDEYEVYKAE